MIISHVPRYVVRNFALASGPGAARTPAGWNRWRERHRLCVVSLSFVSRSRLGQFHGLMVQPFNTNPAGRHRRASVEGGPTLGGGATVPRAPLPNWLRL